MSNGKAEKELMQVAGSKLTPLQKQFVDNLFIPGTSNVQAATLAGYSERSAHVQASRTLRLPHVQEYINACVTEAIQTHSIRAMSQVAQLSTTAKSEYVRLQAGQDILDRAGHKAVDKSMVAVRGEVNVNIDLS